MPTDRLTAAAMEPVPTPFYVFDLVGVEMTGRRMRAAWEAEFPHFTLAYSYKTNPLKAITRTLRRAGAAAEVVSGPELELALQDGHDPSQILFDGPVKTDSELRRALELGVRIQCDSLDEVRRLAQLALPSRWPAPRISLRVAGVFSGRRLSRFGMTINEFRAASLLLAEVGTPVTGVHFNTGQHPPDAAPWRRHLRHYAPLIRDALRSAPSGKFVVDIGGGFPARSSMYGEPLPPPELFARAVRAAFDRHQIPVDAVNLVIEPGRSLVEDHAVLVTTVKVIKHRPRRDLAIMDAGTNLVRSITTWHHPVKFLRAGTHPYDVHGALCFENDTFATRLLGPPDLVPGDRLLIGAVGAYDIPSANPWLRQLPSIYAVDADGHLDEIRRSGEGIRI